MIPADWTPAAIRALRADLGLSQARFAARLGVALNTVARWERGERAPNAYHALRLARARRPLPAARGQIDGLDLDLALARATADDAGQAAMDAVAHAERRGLSPLALALAGNATIDHAYGVSAAEWIVSKAHLERARLEQAVGELMGAGLWPWGR